MVDRREVEDDEGSVEAQTGCGGSVEHAAQIAVDESAQFQRHVPTVLHQHGTGGAEVQRRIHARIEERIDNGGEGRRSRPDAPRPPGTTGRTGPTGPPGGLTQRGVDRGTLPGKEVPAEAGHGQRRRQHHPSSHDLVTGLGARPVGGLFGVERIESHRSAGTERRPGPPPTPRPRARTPPWGR